MVKVQVLIMCKNSESCIENTIMTYYGKVYRIKVFDTGSTDETLNVLKKLKKKGIISYSTIKFKDFSSARNECLDLSMNNTEFTMFIDDSYELVGDLFELNFIPDYVDCISVKIQRESMNYFSKRIVRTSKSLRYRGKIHEEIYCKESYFSNIIVNDIKYEDHAKRTSSRLFSDIKCLEGLSDPRSIYFSAGMHFQLWSRGLCAYQKVIALYKKRLETKHFPEEEFLSALNIGLIYWAVELLNEAEYYNLLAASIFPPRRAEAYYNNFGITNNFEYLKLAYEARNDSSDSKLPKHDSAYGDSGDISRALTAYKEINNIL